MAWQPCKNPHSQAPMHRTHLMEESEEWGIGAITPNRLLGSKISALTYSYTRNGSTLREKNPLDISARLNIPQRHDTRSRQVKRDRMAGSIPADSGGATRYLHSELFMINNNKPNPFTDVVSVNVNHSSNNLIDQGPTASLVEGSCQQQEAGARTEQLPQRRGHRRGTNPPYRHITTQT